MRVKLGLKKLMNIKPIYEMKSLILRKIPNEGVKKKKQGKEIDLENLHKFWEGREKILDAFESKIFSIKSKGAGILNPNHSKLKILTHKWMLQRLPIALAHLKGGNNSESLLNEIREVAYSLYQSKQITKKVYNNIIKSIQWNYKDGYYIYELRKH